MNNYTVLASVTSDGVKTQTELLNELYAITGDITDPKTIFLYDTRYYYYLTTNTFFTLSSNAAYGAVNSIVLDSTNSNRHAWVINTGGIAYQPSGSSIPSAGIIYALCK